MNESTNSLVSMLKALEKRRDDRGLMADLRAGLKDNTQMKAWPYLARFCDLNDRYRADVFRTMAGLFASHPLECRGEGMGRLCRRLCDQDEMKSLGGGAAFSEDAKEGPVTKRVKQLLDSDRDEICERVVRIVLYAKSKDIPVDYHALADDLLHWGDRVRRRWAQDFWGGAWADAPAAQGGEEGGVV
ncbi:MAG: type I-E CRISPR-associated protein Cse2/CasB [Mailhella sp.]|nr:type I-E CRISPR-associated protein Cse2/CasB [Mailhella sp.]